MQPCPPREQEHQAWHRQQRRRDHQHYGSPLERREEAPGGAAGAVGEGPAVLPSPLAVDQEQGEPKEEQDGLEKGGVILFF